MVARTSAPILFEKRQTLESVEDLAAANFAATLKAANVTFDLRALQSVSFYASTILLGWVTHLCRRGVPVVVEASDGDADGSRVLSDGRLLAAMSAVGADVNRVHTGQGRRFGVPVDFLNTRPLEVALEATAAELRGASDEFAEDSIRDLCNGVLFELLENAKNHGGGASAHFGVSVLAATTPVDPFFPTFAAAEKYLEIAVGDIGVGIDATLHAHVPRGYASPFKGVELTGDHLVVAYAFEFSSTSDPDGRRDRLRRIMQSPEIDYRRVATGLSCVLNIVRDRHGQIVVRTPRALLSIDYSRGGLPVVRTAKNIGVKTIAPIDGTHFLLRFPARRVSTPNVYSQRVPELLKNTDVIAPFAQAPEITELERLASAVERTDIHLQQRQRSTGITVIEPSRTALSERAKGVYAAALVTMPRGARHLICLGNYNLEPPIGDPTTYFPPAAPDDGVILEGNLATNEFRNVRVASDSPAPPVTLASPTKDAGVFSLNTQVLLRLREVHATYLRNLLSRALKSPAVRLAAGPFLIEGQYLTNVFYSVWELLADRLTRSEFAWWVANFIPDDCEIVIAVTAPVAALATELKALRRQMRKGEIEVVTDPENTPRLHRDGRERRAVALADVVARGDVLNSVIQSLQPVLVQAVIALVDARPDETSADFFRFTVGGIERDVRLVTVVREPIQTFGSIDDARRALRASTPDAQFGLFEPVVKVIDPNTHRPTVYIRPDRQVHDSSEKILKAAHQGSALVVRHVEYQSRHYAIYLDFPKLFATLQEDILRWIQETVPRTLPRHYIIVNHDKSLDNLAGEFYKVDPSATISEIDRHELKAPYPPAADTADDLTVVILPGSASGETARRAIEFASRRRSPDILVLILIARMEPAHFAFLQTIPRYFDSSLRVECFSRFGVRAYPNELSCELCVSRGLIAQLRNSVSAGKLADVLDEKLLTLAAIHVDDASALAPTTSDDVTRAKLRSEYEAAEYDLKARQDLVDVLEYSYHDIDLFLDVISLESESRHFTIPALRRRLLKTYDTVLSRVHDILWRVEAPFDLSGKMAAILHLAWQDFIPAAPRLLRAFAASPAAFAEVCIAIARVKCVPTGIDAFLSEANAGAITVDVPLLQSTLEAVTRPVPVDDDAAFVTEIATLWSRLVRSSLVTVRLPLLARQATTISGSPEELRTAARHAHEGWNVEVADLIARLLGRRVWRVISARHSVLAEKVVSLCRTMNELNRLATGSFPADEAFGRASVLTSDAESDRIAIITAIERLFINPCRAIEMAREFNTDSGHRVQVDFDFDQTAPLVFTDVESLDEAVDQIRLNWCKHNAGRDVRARIIIRREGDFVAIEFEDDVAAPIEPTSEGGIRFFHKFCEDHGGKAHIRDMGDAPTKSIIFRLRADIQRQVQKK